MNVNGHLVKTKASTKERLVTLPIINPPPDNPLNILMSLVICWHLKSSQIDSENFLLNNIFVGSMDELLHSGLICGDRFTAENKATYGNLELII
ncbi:CLUMA_CG005252, isoform A [Clunio marinus]|uniref:CLUMA_CG005252, isoform A n=1 Tax=Clunio marinus TaxID=568069 RepID=A0A1J1HYI4_9DIPT|nr:CLUMA_CG005252, isoform A [Clunio marinus]